MEPEKVLAHSPRILTQEQREFYFDQGYLVLEQIIPQAWMDRLNAVTEEFVERSRALARSDAIFDLEPGHTSENPRLRRLMNPVETASGVLGVRVRVALGRHRGGPCRPECQR